MKVGVVYNMVYVGPNKAYAKVNGKQTIRVLEITPDEIKVMELFGQFGNPLSKEITSGETIYPISGTGFDKVELYECSNESEWFIKSVKLTSLAKAIEAKLIHPKTLRNQAFRSNRFTASFNRQHQLAGVYASFFVRPTKKYPLLQNLYIVWKNWEVCERDLRKHGAIVNF